MEQSKYISGAKRILRLGRRPSEDREEDPEPRNDRSMAERRYRRFYGDRVVRDGVDNGHLT